MSYRSQQGLGLVMETTPTGLRFVPTIMCVSQAERNEALSKCDFVTEIRGIGGVRDPAMTGRLAGVPACTVKNMPVCPTPTCLDQFTAQAVAEAIAGTGSHPELESNGLMLYALANLPYCKSVPLPPIPACLTPDLAAARDYCVTNGQGGTDKAKKAMCWAAMRDPVWWGTLKGTPACPPPPPPAAYVPPVSTPAYVPPADEIPTTEYEYVPPEKTEASMAGMWGILALLAVGGGGYYMYRRSKR
jgi:hypothetical protein